MKCEILFFFFMNGFVHIAAYQCSKRGGEILCSINGDRVELTGAIKIILKGEIFFPNK